MKKLCLYAILTLVISLTNSISQDLGSGIIEEDTQRQKIKLNFWHFWSDPVRKQYVYSIIAEYESLHPEVEIVPTELSWSTGYEEIKTAFEKEYPVDVIELGSDMIKDFYLLGKIKDITQEVQDIIDQYVDVALTPVTFEGKIYGLPWVLDTRVMFYNKNLLQLAGYDPNIPPKTINELIEMAKKIHNIRPRVYGFGMNARERHVMHKKIFPILWSNNGTIFSEDYSRCIINNKQNIEAMKLYISLKPYSLVASQNEIDTAFCEGRVGFCISGSWLISRIKRDYPKLDFGITTIPVVNPQYKSVSILGAEYLVINSATEHYVEAINFIKFMVSKEKSVELCNGLKMFLPPFKEYRYENVSWLEPDLAKVMNIQINNSYFVPQIRQWIQIKDFMEDEFANIIEGKKTVEESFKDIQENVNKLLRKTKSK